MEIILIIVMIVVAVGAIAVLGNKRNAQGAAARLDDAKAEARRWVERLGGQVMSLTGTDDASKQALADAAERYTAAGSQLDQANTADQCRLVTETAMEGLYYVRAARTAMGMDPGPELPATDSQRKAGTVTEDRRVNVQGEDYEVSPRPGSNTPHYYPGGNIGGRPVPQGWYSRPWWKTALIGGAGAVGGLLVADALFSGMSGIGYDAAYSEGFGDGMGADGDVGGDAGGDFGGGDFGGDFGGGDFGGFDF